jgi:outer membrane lipopolysaccharide assembly protein LptE/RlpB
MRLVSIFLLIFLVGCGFQMRGTFVAPEYLKTVRILPDDPYTPLQKSIRASLMKAGTNIVSPSRSNVTTINLLSSIFSEAALSYDTSGQAERVQRTLTISYQVTAANGKILTNAATITASREFVTSQTQLLSSDNELATIDRELVRDIAVKLIRQLTKLKVDNANLPR